MKMLHHIVIIICTIIEVSSSCARSNICLNGGTCIADGLKEKCVCQDSYFGIACENRCSAYQMWLQNPTTGQALQNYLEHAQLVVAPINGTMEQTTIFVTFYMQNLRKDKLTEILQKILGTSLISVEDIDECSTRNIQCGSNEQCSNTVGSFECACASGYERSDDVCTDTSKWTQSETKISAIIVCSVLFLLALAVGVVYVKRCRRRKKLEKKKAERRKMKNQQKKLSGLDRPPVFITRNPRSTSSLSEIYSNRAQSSIPRSNSSAYSLNDMRHNYGQLTFVASKYGTRHVDRLNRDMYRDNSSQYADYQPDFQYGYVARNDNWMPQRRDKSNYPKPYIVRFQDDYAPSLNHGRNTYDMNENYK